MKISNKKSSWINDARFDPQVHHGFVYLIVNLVNDRKYIGRKYTHITSKGRIVSESNWRNYWGSCKSLNADIVK